MIGGGRGIRVATGKEQTKGKEWYNTEGTTLDTSGSIWTNLIRVSRNISPWGCHWRETTSNVAVVRKERSLGVDANTRQAEFPPVGLLKR